VDIYFATTVLWSAGGLIFLALEARRTGRFAWSFERPYAVSGVLRHTDQRRALIWQRSLHALGSRKTHLVPASLHGHATA
jgi:hypothetical protein